MGNGGNWDADGQIPFIGAVVTTIASGDMAVVSVVLVRCWLYGA